MTAQAAEEITYKGKKYYMATEPLEQYLEGLKDKPALIAPNTACWRGYYGTWKVKYGKLYLIDLVCYAEEYKEMGMEYLFPDQKVVFAEWFTGEIRIPQGEMLEYVHMGYESVFENDLYLKFDKGVVVDEWVVDNRIENN